MSAASRYDQAPGETIVGSGPGDGVLSRHRGSLQSASLLRPTPPGRKPELSGQRIDPALEPAGIAAAQVPKLTLGPLDRELQQLCAFLVEAVGSLVGL